MYDYSERMLCELGIYHYVVLSNYGESIFLIDRFPRRFSELARNVFDENDVRVFGVFCCHDHAHLVFRIVNQCLTPEYVMRRIMWETERALSCEFFYYLRKRVLWARRYLSWNAYKVLCRRW